MNPSQKQKVLFFLLYLHKSDLFLYCLIREILICFHNLYLYLLILGQSCQHYFLNFLHKLSPATSIPHKQGIFAMFLFCFLLFYKERKLLSELFHQICQIVIFIQTCKYSAVSGIIYDHLAQGSQVSEDIKCVYCPNN